MSKMADHLKQTMEFRRSNKFSYLVNQQPKTEPVGYFQGNEGPEDIAPQPERSRVLSNHRLMIVIIALIISIGYGMMTTFFSLKSISKTKSMSDMASLIERQNSKIQQMENAISNLKSENSSQLVSLNGKLKNLNKDLSKYQQEVSEAVIDSSLLRVSVDEIKSSQADLVDKYIELDQVISKINL